MASIRKVKQPEPEYFATVQTQGHSVPEISWGLFLKILDRIAKQYSEVLRRIDLDELKKIIASFPSVSIIDRPIELEVLIVSVNDKCVTFWLRFDIYGTSSADVREVLRLFHQRLPVGSKIRFEHDIWVADVWLPKRPRVVTTLHNGPAYFLEEEGPSILDFAVHRK